MRVSLKLVTYINRVDRKYPLRKQANGKKLTAIWACVKLLYYSVTFPSYRKQLGRECELSLVFSTRAFPFAHKLCRNDLRIIAENETCYGIEIQAFWTMMQS